MQENINFETVCFVISSIGSNNSDERRRSDDIFEGIIKPVVEDLGYTTERADKIMKAGKITEQIVEYLIYSGLVIADLTDSNANVLYELGIRHAVGKPVIQIIEDPSKLPFDLGDERTIPFDWKTQRGGQECRDKIKEFISEINKQKTFTHPVAEKIEQQRSAESKDEIKQRYADLSVTIKTVVRNIQELSDRVPSKETIDGYRNEIRTLKLLKDAGVEGVYRNREIAFRRFLSALDAEHDEIMVIGSSLLGLLQKSQYKEVSDKLKFKINSTKTIVKFLLTHPAVADLRAEQENRKFTHIGDEILKSLEILRDWGLSPENVKLYKGTPTIFAIKTRKKMLLNPYAYFATAFTSPCIIVEHDPESNSSYFYSEYDNAHFGAWDTNSAEAIHDFNQTISNLRKNLPDYTRRVESILKET